jgi:RIO-like serine/threonine protein kinase
MTESELLKKDLFGEIRLSQASAGKRVIRDTSRASPAIRWLARALLRREARVLAALDGVDGIPQLVEAGRDRLVREYLEGQPMHRARPEDPAYFRRSARLLRQLHRAGVVHNDLAKEPNILVCDDGSPAFVDFQLAMVSARRGPLFRVLAWDDLRHLLKHKRTYRPQDLTTRERNILATPSLPSRIFSSTIKPAYLFITRRLLGWADREGAGDRGERR